MLRRLVLLSLVLFSALDLFATHNRAGNITYEQIDALTMRVTVTTYTKASSQTADRPFLTVDWGDGTMTDVQRSNNGGQGLILENDTKYNLYIETHTYAGRGKYTVSVTDPNRNGNILNVAWPNSVTIPFYIETTFTILSPQFQGKNSSAILLQPPIDVACVGQKFIHNPNAYDPEGDSLAYEWTIPRMANDMDVPLYVFPDKIEPGSNNSITLNEKTGDIIWDAPQKAGEYNIAFIIKEYREGVLLNTIVRDMQILVKACDNRPPVLDVPEGVCLEAFETLDVPITATDSDMPAQLVRLTALGAPLDFTNSPAEFISSGTYDPSPVTARLKWTPICDHIREEEYQVIVKAEDDYGDGALVDLKTINIQVVGPAPENVMLETLSDGNEVRWDYPYICLGDSSELFQGFTIWRREQNDNTTLGDCNTDLSEQGYTPIATLNNADLSDPYIYLDKTAEKGKIYCYRVTALFGRRTDSGQLFNVVHGKPSDFDCVNIRKDVPFIVKASVETTSSTAGQNLVEWIPPEAEELDTSIYGGPYTFSLIEGNQTLTELDFPSYSQIPAKMSFSHGSINTQTESHTYTVNLMSNGVEVGNSIDAQTIFLRYSSNSEGVSLTWDVNVPWANEKYTVWKKESNQNDFAEIGSTSTRSFLDSQVEKDKEYCYYIESEGKYFYIDYEGIINHSQEECLKYEFEVPPCEPFMSIEAVCGSSPQERQDSFSIKISWTMQQCANNSNLAGFNVYEVSSDSTLIKLNSDIIPSTVSSYLYQIPHGRKICFQVEAVGKDGATSTLPEAQCISGDGSCVDIELPNTFTPNGDGKNDIYKPISYNFVDNFDIKIYNRWGNKIYETSDIEINWDGSDLNGNAVSKGVYFYEVDYDFTTEENKVISKSQTGFIEVLR